MHKDIRFQTVLCWIKHPAFLLFFFGGTGLIIGTLLAASADITAFSWMRLAVNCRLSIICHLAAQILPFLIAAYAVNISGLWLLYAVLSCKLLSFAYIGSLIWFSFGSAGWLVRGLFQFSDIILVPVLCWYSFRRVLTSESSSKCFGICMGIVAATALINWLFISPFLERIINI